MGHTGDSGQTAPSSGDEADLPLGGAKLARTPKTEGVWNLVIEGGKPCRFSVVDF